MGDKTGFHRLSHIFLDYFLLIIQNNRENHIYLYDLA